jgi:hypothetical protein
MKKKKKKRTWNAVECIAEIKLNGITLSLRAD